MWLLQYQPPTYEVGSEMLPAWLLHTVAGGLLTGLLLAMVIGFCLVDSNAGKQCAHKKQQKQSSDSGQFCCLCGNARNRKEEAMKSRTEVGYFQSLVDAACVTFFSSFRSRTSQRPGIVRSWPNLRSLLRTVGRRNPPISNSGDGLFPAEPVACTENTSPVTSPTDGSDADSRTTITTTITTTTSPSASAASSCGVTSSSNEKEDTKQPSQRRLVLEILMSTSGGEMPRATRVRLKMETNSSTDVVAGTSPGEDRTLQERDAISKAEVASTTSGPTPSRKTGSVSKRPKSSNQVPKQGISAKGDSSHVAAVDAGVHGSDLKTKAATCVSDESEQVTGGHGSLVSSKMNSGDSLSSSTTTSKSKQNGYCTSPSKLKSKAGCAPPQNSRLSSASPTATACSVNFGGQSAGACKAPANFNNLALDGLGSLRISLLEGGVKGKSSKECSKGVTADIASALAALNVDSISGKGVSTGGGTVLGAMLTEAGKAGAGSKHSDDLLLDEEVIGDGSGSEQGLNEGEEHQSIGVKKENGHDEGDFAEEKKEKKKRKHRVRRNKGKTSSVSGTGCLSTDLKESEKLSTDHGGIPSMRASCEVELGCICGTAKGCHSSSCPYPFTCSGSMVQRKIKEQYDELVRSNAAKTLTLAQVGRFTTCLVEAKVALQQKSETIQRRLTIAKSLLAKADKSSFDRLCGQIYGLENEQKKLEEDTVVYNRLQEQLKLSPAYLKMLEYGRAHFELQPNTGQLIEKIDTDVEELSFEELLAQEKKDSFWQKHGPARSFVQVS